MKTDCGGLACQEREGTKMVTDTLSEGLETYRIGQKIRALRLAKGLGLAQLGSHTGLSAGMLSKLERGQIFPTLPTLLRIALVFGVGLDHFFVDGGKGPIMEVVRAKDRLRMPAEVKSKPAYYFESLDFPVSDAELGAYLSEFPPDGGASTPHAHEGVELIYVIRGAMILIIHDEETRLEAGDSVYFDSGFEHSYRVASDEGCQAIVAIRNAGAA